MSLKLNQVLAIEKSVKDKAHQVLTKKHQETQAPALVQGLHRKYEAKDEDGEQFPEESQRLQVRLEDSLKETAVAMAELFDITAQKDFANCSAKADVAIDGKVILEKVPATYLLWLEKKLVDVHTFVAKLQTLPPDEDWAFDANQNCYRSTPRKTAKTKKIPKPFVAYEATKEHPAQVQVVSEDVLQGYWTQVKFSGALPATRVAEMLGRVEKMQHAVKQAREEANMTTAEKRSVGEKVFSYLFAGG